MGAKVSHSGQACGPCVAEAVTEGDPPRGQPVGGKHKVRARSKEG